MRKNLFIWFVIWILSLLAVSFYGGVVTYGFCALVSFVPVVSLLYLLYVYLFFHMYQKVDTKWIVAKQSAPFYFTLVNDYYFLFAGISVKFYSDFSTVTGLSDDIEYEFLPKSGFTEHTQLTCDYRGEYKVGIKSVVIEDYFRLFKIEYINKEPLKVFVRPRILYPESLSDFDFKLSQKESDTNKSEPDVLVREYDYGDDIRLIHWNNSAKTSKLMVRKQTGYKQDAISVFLSTQRVSEEIDKYLIAENKILELNLALVMYFVKKSIPVCNYYICPELVTTNINRIEDFDAHYEKVSSVRFEAGFNDEVLYQEALSTQIYGDSFITIMILQRWSEKLPQTLENLTQNGNHVIIYLVSEHMIEEFGVLKLGNVSVRLIHPLDDLDEVL